MHDIKAKPIEIFCGTGGVGKTTLATSRALYLAKKGYKVLLITIDPAIRLKQILGLKEENRGQVCRVSSIEDQNVEGLYAQLMSPKATLKRLALNSKNPDELDNTIVNILTRPHGGMNEIMATIEVQHHFEQKTYDCIVLDTPPGKHFLDFLHAGEKINQFFDKSFVEIFRFLGKRFGHQNNKEEKSSIFSKVLGTGVKKLLSYLEKVTGKHFVEDFVEAVIGLYNNRDAFIHALSFQEDLKVKENSNWFLVTSVEQVKTKEAKILKNEASDFMHQDSFLAINKSLLKYIDQWEVSNENDALKHLRNTMKARESAIKERVNDGYKSVLLFPEVLGGAPGAHVLELESYW